MKIHYAAFNMEALRFIHNEAKFHYNQYQVWLRDHSSVRALETALNHLREAETFINLLEKITNQRHGGGYTGECGQDIKARIKSFQNPLYPVESL